ncbi:hypothetical protein [Rheinheimera sp.]|uniref:hypothetical protein n=1 Tax=Rheinheimera sp. TaxID=1869214 RepID=UPI00307DC02B
MRLSLLWVGLLATTAQAAMPQFDLYLADIQQGKVASAQLISPKAGYINQPAFSKDGGTLYYTLEQPQDKTDIGFYQLREKQHGVLAETSLSEYSPTLLQDGSGLSTVVVEADGTQRLWKMDWQGKTSVLNADVKGVGYHAWGAQNSALLFILGEKDDKHTVRYLASDGSLTLLATNVGRGIGWLAPGKLGAFVTVQQGSARLTFFAADQAQVYPTDLALPTGGQDLVWFAPDQLLVSAGQSIYRLQTSGDSVPQWAENAKGWQPYLDLSAWCKTEVSRFAFNDSATQLAFVCKK